MLLFMILMFNQYLNVLSVDDCKCKDDLIDDPNLGPIPPVPGEEGSQVPLNWKWKAVLVDDLCSDNRHTKERAQRLFQKNTLYSILTGQEEKARNEYEEKEREHIQNKQLEYNQMMKKQWKKDRMNSLPSTCIILR